ncbi:MAG: 6-phospho-3-hexuloisomerase [Candidatus Altiarchaeales archaeon]|nr:MAG: 6-phospho-3-hexuloisomerase [Candidatus Altiarchaeales archaeon]
MPVKNAMLAIVKHVSEIIEELDESEIDTMIEEIQNANRIFLLGAGRSGLAARAFAMRLVQLGLTAYVVGESVTPAMTNKDLLIAVSGSGETTSVVNAAKIAKGVGSKILTVTSYPKSSLGKISDYIVTVQGRTKIDIERDPLKNQIEGKHASLTPLGTLFEDTVMIFFDGIIARLMIQLHAEEEDLKRRHPTLE